jgi:hypothetical protein
MEKYLIESSLPDGYNYFGGFTTMPSDKTVILNLWTPYLHQIQTYNTSKEANEINERLGVEGAKVLSIRNSHVNLALKQIHLHFKQDQHLLNSVHDLTLFDRFYYKDEGCACTVVGFADKNVLYKTSKNRDRVGLISADSKEIFKTFRISRLTKEQLQNFFK